MNIATRPPTVENIEAQLALNIARQYVDVLEPHCERIAVAGSLRRRKTVVSDIEILFVPILEPDPELDDFFKPRPPINKAESAIRGLLKAGVLAPRPNVRSTPTWGLLNKLGVDVGSGVAIDLFTAWRGNWYNYLVCRTGGVENNVRIATAAQNKGWKWNPYGSGFTRRRHGDLTLTLERHDVRSEQEVFEFVGLPYLEPCKR
jgi:DNA polymerase/3'-5' exonuclease PolX